MPPQVIHVTWVNPSMLLHLKKMLSGDSLFDGSCLHHLYVYYVNIGQDQ